MPTAELAFTHCQTCDRTARWRLELHDGNLYAELLRVEDGSMPFPASTFVCKHHDEQHRALWEVAHGPAPQCTIGPIVARRLLDRATPPRRVPACVSDASR